jgi:deoxyribodipyrimidine photo-lyase
MTALLWFTRDLRVHDHPALHAALGHDRVVPVFCLDERLLRGRHESPVRTAFVLECLKDLGAALRERGSALLVRHGPPERELPRLAGEAGAEVVYCSADTTPFARARARRVRDQLPLEEPPGLHAVDDLAKPYKVFTPFHRWWLEQPRRDVLEAPRRLPAVRLRRGRVPSPEGEGVLRGGEREGRARMDWFLDGPVKDYERDKDVPAVEGTSRLSAYLHLGCVSPRELEERLPRGKGADAFRRQLAWRDFHHQVLLHHPDKDVELQERYRRLDWNDDRELFDAWREGRTGFPLVDAGMRQLRHEGWMHNRVRLVVASFLTKQLGIDWRWGEEWFMRRLVDGDEADNNGNWQWIASVGTDPAPVYRRLYNPARQQERLDPDGVYVRRHVPELRDVADEHLAEPPQHVRRACGYPDPVVDQAVAREAALERYGRSRNGG